MGTNLIDKLCQRTTQSQRHVQWVSCTKCSIPHSSLACQRGKRISCFGSKTWRETPACWRETVGVCVSFHADFSSTAPVVKLHLHLQAERLETKRWQNESPRETCKPRKCVIQQILCRWRSTQSRLEESARKRTQTRAMEKVKARANMVAKKQKQGTDIEKQE